MPVSSLQVRQGDKPEFDFEVAGGATHSGEISAG